MIYLSLFWEFLKIGAFSFGGAYGAIALIRESVIAQGWADEAMFGNILAVSESTPGPIMINAATYIGSRQAGALGAAVATLGVVLPSFLVMLLITAFLGGWMERRPVQAALAGIKPCLMGVILCTGIWMAMTAVLGADPCAPVLDRSSLLLLGLLAALMLGTWSVRKREISPILLILIAAALGIVLF